MATATAAGGGVALQTLNPSTLNPTPQKNTHPPSPPPGNVDSAKAQLMKYLNSISSNRMLMVKVFLVLMAFLAVFVLFVA